MGSGDSSHGESPGSPRAGGFCMLLPTSGTAVDHRGPVPLGGCGGLSWRGLGLRVMQT